MLTKLVIDNFRCIRNAELALGPMTVLVGPNASGKTTILDALNLSGPASASDRSWRAAPNPIQVVIATHSAELLEYCLPEEVRFLDRDPQDGSVRVHQADTSSSDWEKTFAVYRQSLGSVWLSGGLGGVPGR